MPQWAELPLKTGLTVDASRQEPRMEALAGQPEQLSFGHAMLSFGCESSRPEGSPLLTQLARAAGSARWKR